MDDYCAWCMYMGMGMDVRAVRPTWRIVGDRGGKGEGERGKGRDRWVGEEVRMDGMKEVVGLFLFSGRHLLMTYHRWSLNENEAAATITQLPFLFFAIEFG